MRERLWTALNSDDAVAGLAEIVRAWKADGCTKAEAENRLSSLLAEVGVNGTSAQDDAVRDVLDLVVGYCSPHARLFP